jgi:hypothetical protein
MKNKKLTYFLGSVVLIVWGMIIYRIFNAATTGDNDSSAAIVAPVKEAYNDFSIPKDTTHLLLNYRDPFGLVAPKDTARIVSRKSTGRKVPAAIKPMNWDFIHYSGYMLNPRTKKLIALVTINGQNATLSEGQTRYQVKLIRNLRDSIKISFEGKTKFIGIK